MSDQQGVEQEGCATCGPDYPYEETHCPTCKRWIPAGNRQPPTPDQEQSEVRRCGICGERHGGDRCPPKMIPLSTLLSLAEDIEEQANKRRGSGDRLSDETGHYIDGLRHAVKTIRDKATELSSDA